VPRRWPLRGDERVSLRAMGRCACRLIVVVALVLGAGAAIEASEITASYFVSTAPLARAYRGGVTPCPPGVLIHRRVAAAAKGGDLRRRQSAEAQANRGAVRLGQDHRWARAAGAARCRTLTVQVHSDNGSLWPLSVAQIARRARVTADR
jgi:hypothetical protein